MGKSERDTYVEHWGEVRDTNSTWPHTVLEPSRTVHYERHRVRRHWVAIVVGVAVIALALVAWL